MPCDYTISCRLNDEDRCRLTDQAAKLNMKPSDYLRYLIRIPVESKNATGGDRFIVIDADTLASLSRELVRWGYHYNQAVHSMNTIALFIKRDRLDLEYFSRTIDEIEQNLESIDAGRAEIAEELARIGSNTFAGDR